MYRPLAPAALVAMLALSVTMTFDEYGEPVNVEPPPADEVTDGDGFTLP